MIFEDKHHTWQEKLWNAIGIISGFAGIITAVSLSVKTGIEAYEAVRRNMPKKKEDDKDPEERKIVLP
jgi:hypothetical protein